MTHAGIKVTADFIVFTAIRFNMIFAVLCGMGLTFTLLGLLADSPALGVMDGIIATAVWFTVGGWWLNMETDIPGIAMLFWGLGIVCLIFTAYGSFRLMGWVGRTEEDRIFSR